MAQLYFKYGAMGSSKTANALMTRFNYEERGQKTLLVKPRLDTRDGDHMVVSRIGLTYPCIYFDEMQAALCHGTAAERLRHRGRGPVFDPGGGHVPGGSGG